MHALAGIRSFLGKISEKIGASRQEAHFTCGVCERNEGCGLPPNDNCPVKAEQIARDKDYRQRAPAGYYKAVWPR